MAREFARPRLRAAADHTEAEALPPLRALLCSGGDGRIVLDPAGSTNRYGCQPWPDGDIAAFGSATASVISERGYAAAGDLRQRLCDALAEGAAPERLYDREMVRLRQDLGGALQIDPAVEIVFAASGTDLHLLATDLVLGPRSGMTAAEGLAVMVSPAETGSGVPAALGRRHFDHCTAQGAMVTAGASLTGTAPRVATIALRRADGSPRPVEEVDADASRLVETAVRAGRKVLLVVTDLTKTGLIAPTPERALDLRDRHPDCVEILVDACQFRLAPATLRAYLDAECLVALTGSKFLTGPAFSGALLVGQAAARRLDLARRPLSPGLNAYSARSDWPAHFSAALTLPAVANFGLALRWAAALAELKAFLQAGEAERAAFFTAFAAAVERRLGEDAAFLPLAGRSLKRGALGAAAGSWDRVPTIFPFLLRRVGPSGKAHLLDAVETAAVHRLIAQPLHGPAAIALKRQAPGSVTMRCQLGQPVACGDIAGQRIAALRLCASARLAVEATSQGEAGVAAVIARALASLDRVAQAARIVSSAGADFSAANFS